MTAGGPPAGGPPARLPASVPVRGYNMQEATFGVPLAWQDQTVHILAGLGPAGGPPECSLVIHRDSLQQDESLDSYVARQLANLEATLPGFALLREGELTLGGARALDAEYRCSGEAGLLHQRQVYTLRFGRAITVTATAPERLWARHAPAFETVLATWQFVPSVHDPRGGGPAGGAPPMAR